MSTNDATLVEFFGLDTKHGARSVTFLDLTIADDDNVVEQLAVFVHSHSHRSAIGTEFLCLIAQKTEDEGGVPVGNRKRIIAISIGKGSISSSLDQDVGSRNCFASLVNDSSLYDDILTNGNITQQHSYERKHSAQYGVSCLVHRLVIFICEIVLVSIRLLKVFRNFCESRCKVIEFF